MAQKKFKIGLSQEEIQGLIDSLKAYKKELYSKNEIFVRRLCEIGIPVIDANIASAKGDSNKSHYTHIEVQHFQDYAQARLIVEGADLLFIEFGSGIHYNGSAGSSPHPKGGEFGYTIGSYGKGQGKKDGWWYYADTGEAVYSHGTEATMPVYKASLEIIQKIRQIAREVFGNG